MSQEIRKFNDPIVQATSALQESKIVSVTQNLARSEETVNALMARKKNFLQRLFPDATTRAQHEGELKLVQTESDFHVRTLKILRETQVQSLQEMCNLFVSQGKAGTRKERASFIVRKREELQEEIDRECDKFLHNLDQRWEKINTLKNIILREAEIERLERDLIGFMEVIRKVVTDFENIASESIKA